MTSTQSLGSPQAACAELVVADDAQSRRNSVRSDRSEGRVRFRSGDSHRNSIRSVHSPTRSVASEYEAQRWWSNLGTFRSEAEKANWAKDVWYDFRAFWAKFFETCCKLPTIPLATLLFFLLLCGGSLSAARWYYHREQNDRKEAALAVATSLASTLSAQIDLVLLPMFALAVDVTIDDGLFPAPSLVEQWPVDPTRPESHRVAVASNASATFGKRFHLIAKNLQGLVAASKAIMNVQVAPRGVVGWIHPLEGNEMAIGHDLLMDPKRIPDAVKTINTQKLVMAGPVPLVQGGTMMIARIPSAICPLPHPCSLPACRLSASLNRRHHFATITAHKSGIDTETIPLIGETVRQGELFWGFCVSLINFKFLLEEIGFETELASHHMRFNLTRSHALLADDGVSVIEARKVVAASAPQSGTEGGDAADRVEGVEVQVMFHEQAMNLEVTCGGGCDPTWWWWSVAVCVGGSLVLSCMVLVLVIMRAQHSLLLHKMLPPQAIKKINRGKQVIDEFEVVSIFFSDIVGFTSMAGSMSPIEVMQLLNDLYQAFDKLAEKHQVYKVETIGDAYMVVSGAPEPLQAPEAAYRVVMFALDCLEAVKTLETTTGHQVKIRCGVHSGPVVAGVVGAAMPRYCFFGDTVNTASRMESTSTVGRLQISASCFGYLQVWIDQGNKRCFHVRLRGEAGVQIKGKGRMQTYWVERESERQDDDVTADNGGPSLSVPVNHEDPAVNPVNGCHQDSSPSPTGPIQSFDLAVSDEEASPQIFPPHPPMCPPRMEAAKGAFA